MYVYIWQHWVEKFKGKLNVRNEISRLYYETQYLRVGVFLWFFCCCYAACLLHLQNATA